MSFPRYPEYKDSGVEWLGDVPGHWQVHRLSSLFRQVAEQGLEDLPVLTVSIHSGVSDREFDDNELDRKVTRIEDRTAYKRVAPGDLVYNMMRAWQGGLGSVTVAGLVSPAYVVARPIASFSTFLVEQQLRTPAAVEEMRRHSRGVTDFRLRLYWEEFKSLSVVLPPPAEQREINAFLDRETAKIDALVAEQQNLIALLKEKRQALISHAVTKGLDPDVPMKDSGVAWLGEVPAHWTVAPIKYFVKFRSGGTPSKDRVDYWEGQLPWASAKDLKWERLLDTADHISETAIDDGAANLLDAGTVLIVVRGMILARTFPVALTGSRMAINQDLKGLEPSPKMSAEFLAWYLRGTAAESLSRLDEAGHGTKALRMDAWASLEVSLPPLEEQLVIAEAVDRETARIDELSVEADLAIALLQERRTALISAAVTGKIDVRNFAAAATTDPTPEPA